MLYRHVTEFVPSWDMIYPGDAVLYEYTGAYIPTELTPGKYRLQVWGSGNGRTGRGGYSVGEITIDETVPIFIWCGGYAIWQNLDNPTASPDDSTWNGQRRSYSGGFNGGGYGNGYSFYTDAGTVSFSGAGATDIRIGGNTLYHRVIVAGGAAGYNARYRDHSEAYGAGGGYSTTQTQGRDDGGVDTPASASGTTGYSFGVGSPASVTRNYKQIPGGGGGGWYGGHSTVCRDNVNVPVIAAGGSGFTFDASRKTQVPSGYLVPEKYLLTNANSLSGTSTSIPTPTNPLSTGKGLTGYGKALITKLPVATNPKATTEIYIKENNMWVKYCDLV